MSQLVFWCSGLLLLHTYFFYPALLLLLDAVGQALGNFRGFKSGKAVAAASASGEPFVPFVSMVVAAYNEAGCIGSKVQNSLALDYPAGRFELLIGSDGSTDGTDEIVQRASGGDRRVKLLSAPRAGKTSVLNRCVPSASGDIVILSDANTQVDAAAIKKLVNHFRDPEVGAVCGRLQLFNPRKREYEESAYWTYESMIKMYEGKHGAVMGANGGLYAIRRTLFQTLPASTIVDDFVIPLRMLEHGYKVVYEPAALATEETTEDYGKEFKRRARIAAGNFQSLGLLPGLLSPAQGFRAFAFWSHKVLRWVAPALMALALVSNALLVSGSAFYQATFAAQFAFYALAVAGRAAVFGGSLRKVCSVAYYFVTMNAAIAVGFWRFMRGTQAAAWERTARA